MVRVPQTVPQREEDKEGTSVQQEHTSSRPPISGGQRDQYGTFDEVQNGH